jgi:diacylglycerol kinase family enzyme
MDILLVVNPIAGGNSKDDFVRYAKGYLDSSNISYQFYKTTGKQDAKKVDTLLKKHSHQKVIVVGGDGTLHLLLKPLIHYKCKVGFIPMGSANGMAIELGINKSPKLLFKHYLDSITTHPLDVLSINDTYLLLHLGDVGANANLVAKYDQDEGRGLLTYAKHFWDEFQNLKSFDFEIETDQMDYERKGVMLAICNGRRFGTGIPLNSIGEMDDAVFELVVVKAMDFLDLLKATLSKYNEDFSIDRLETLRAKKATLKFKTPRLLQVDGEVLGSFSKLTVEILPKALHVIKL